MNQWLLYLLLSDDADIKLLKAGYNQADHKFVSYTGGEIYYIIKAKSIEDNERIYGAVGETSRTTISGSNKVYYISAGRLEKAKKNIESLGYTVSVGCL